MAVELESNSLELPLLLLLLLPILISLFSNKSLLSSSLSVSTVSTPSESE